MNLGVLLGGLALLLIWGAWGVTAKFALKDIGMQIVVWAQIAQTLIFPLYFVLFKDLLPLKIQGDAIWWAMVSGAFGILGTLILYLLLRAAPTSIAVPLSALYPVVTIILSYLILHEKITTQQWVGIAFALVAIALLSIDFSQFLPNR